MALHFFKVLLLLVVVSRHEALFSRNHPLDFHPNIRVHLEDDEHLIFPKHATIKLVHPITGHDKFYPFVVPKPLKKQPISKHVKQHLVGKLTLSDGLKVTDTEKNFEKEVGFLELFRPVSLPIQNVGFNSLYGPTQIHRDPQFDDVKPVTEHIEGDLNHMENQHVKMFVMDPAD